MENQLVQAKEQPTTSIRTGAINRELKTTTEQSELSANMETNSSEDNNGKNKRNQNSIAVNSKSKNSLLDQMQTAEREDAIQIRRILLKKLSRQQRRIRIKIKKQKRKELKLEEAQEEIMDALNNLVDRSNITEKLHKGYVKKMNEFQLSTQHSTRLLEEKIENYTKLIQLGEKRITILEQYIERLQKVSPRTKPHIT